MQTEIKYGFVIGVLMIGGIYAEYYAGFNISLAGGSPALSGILFIILGIIMGIREKKLDDKNGLTYFQCFLGGITIAFIAGVIFGGYSFFYARFIDPEYLSKVVYDVEKNMKLHHASDEDIKHNLALVSSSYSPLGQFINGTGATVIIGALVSGIASFFFKKKTPESSNGTY